VGIVVQIEDAKYYAPFTSPKEKHMKMKNGKDFRKIQGGQYGAINFNNMIPVPDKALLEIDINGELDTKYKRLLQNQYRAIKADREAIIRTAEKLRRLVMTEEEKLSLYDKQIKNRCCNLPLLEKVYTEFPLD
jgi:protein AbiQ